MARNIMSVFNQRSRPEDLFEMSPAPSQPLAAPLEPRMVSEINESSPRGAIKLGKSLVFKGELSVSEDVLLLGRVEGSFTHSESLTVGVGGVIIGDVSGRTLIVKGTIEGDVECAESVVLMPGCVVSGDIIAPRINIIEGAQFNGAVKMAPMPEKPKQNYKFAADGSLTEETVDQLLTLLSERKKSS